MPKGLLRYLSLKLMQGKPMSGSEITESIEEHADWKPSPGSIYPMLKKLQETGLIEPHIDTNHDLKRFQITEKGKRELIEMSKLPDHFKARRKSMTKMFWLIHRGMPKKMYESYSNLIESFGTTYKKIHESEEKKHMLQQILKDTTKKIKEIGDETQ